jgi:hypothetical protein
MFENMTTSCDKPTKPLTLEGLKEAFEMLEKCKPKYSKIIMNQKTLDYLMEQGLKYDKQSSYIKIEEFIPDNVILGMWMGNLKSIIKISSDEWKFIDILPDIIPNPLRPNYLWGS